MDATNPPEVLAYEVIIEHGYKVEPYIFQIKAVEGMGLVRTRINVYLKKSRNRKHVTKVMVWAYYPHIEPVCIYERLNFLSSEQIGGALTEAPVWRDKKADELPRVRLVEDLDFDFKVSA